LHPKQVRYQAALRPDGFAVENDNAGSTFKFYTSGLMPRDVALGGIEL
jgi:hypothetical protein